MGRGQCYIGAVALFGGLLGIFLALPDISVYIWDDYIADMLRQRIEPATVDFLRLLLFQSKEFRRSLFWEHPSPFAYHSERGWLLLNELDYPKSAYSALIAGKVADTEDIYVVTGASSGIGLGVATELEKIIYRSEAFASLTYRDNISDGVGFSNHGKKSVNTGYDNVVNQDNQGCTTLEKSLPSDVVASRVVLAVRNVDKAKKALGHIVPSNCDQHKRILRSHLALDLASLTSVRKFVDALEKFALGRSVVLVCNAGIAATLTRNLTEDGNELHFQSNYLGHYLLVRLLMQRKMLKHVLHVSSNVHFLGVIPYSNVLNNNREIVDSGNFGDEDVRKQFFQSKAPLFATDFTQHKYVDTKLYNNIFSNALARKFPGISLVRSFNLQGANS